MPADTAPKATFRKLATQFAVPDVVKTAEYYCNVLGFHLLGYFADPPVYAMVARDEVEMHFGKCEDPQTSNRDFRNSGFDAYVWVDDITSLYSELAASGADIVDGPVKRVYGSTEVEIKDCNGFRIVFGD